MHIIVMHPYILIQHLQNNKVDVLYYIYRFYFLLTVLYTTTVVRILSPHECIITIALNTTEYSLPNYL